MSIPVNCRVTAAWSNLKVGAPPSSACRQAVIHAFRKEVPPTIRDGWVSHTIHVHEDGSLTGAELLLVAQGIVDAWNVARREQDADAAEVKLVGTTPADCRYEYQDNVLICVYNYAITLGGEPWEVDDPANGTADPVMQLDLSWEFKLPDAS